MEPVVLFNKGPMKSLALGFSGFAPGSGSGRGSGARNSNGASNEKYCTYCHKPRHTVETCYRKHGFPPGFKFRNQSSPSVHNFQTQGSVSNSVLKQSKASAGVLPTTSPQFTQDQYQKILALVQQTSISSPQPTSVPSVHHISSTHQTPGAFSLEDDWYS
ncbi:hypothetical protein QN277_022288 [Acacia crassicarpa]|uniref:Uncharacterized protein n=1 Tax=Acacia crassicarpa TaxID=499986 RepID=A0AAE1JJC2_9FABA|nr:hypothetical protein QN277_022288 [Acacia crassicarpa]